jgi:glycosyltransferase involved in cell wall biosynthesis
LWEGLDELSSLLIDVRPAGGAHGARGIGRYVSGLAASVARFPDDLVGRIWVLGFPGPAMDPFGPRTVTTGGSSLPGWIPSWATWRWTADAAIRTSRARAMHATDPQRPWSNPRVPTVVTVYDLIPLREPDLIRSWRLDHQLVYRWYLRQIRSATRIVAISEATSEDLRERLAIAPDRIDVVYPVVEPPAEIRRILPSEPTFLCVGALDPHKQPELALRAFGLFRARTGRGRLRFIGPLDPAKARPLHELAARLGVAGAVTIEGRLTDPDLEDAYASATAVLSTSRIEGFGLPAVEAAVRGIPIIAVETPAALETVDGVAVMVPGDAEAIADAMTDPAEPGELAVRAIRKRYSSTSAAAALADCYRNVLA